MNELWFVIGICFGYVGGCALAEWVLSRNYYKCVAKRFNQDLIEREQFIAYQNERIRPKHLVPVYNSSDWTGR